jgi:uncharacterized membrane protein YuzA (DUF378 family)
MAIERGNANRDYSGLMKVLAIISIIGAINWGLIGFFNWNLVDAIFGGGPANHSALSRLIYAIVGLAGVALAIVFPWQRRVPSTTTAGEVGMGRRVDVRP